MCLTLMCLVMDQAKRAWSSFCIGIGVQTQASSQGTNYNRIFANGSLRQIRLLTTILHVVPIASKEPSGFSKEVSSPNGNPMGRFCGSTENVRSPDIPSITTLMATSCSGLWEKRTLVCPCQIVLSSLSYSPLNQLYDNSRHYFPTC